MSLMNHYSRSKILHCEMQHEPYDVGQSVHQLLAHQQNANTFSALFDPFSLFPPIHTNLGHIGKN